MLKFSNNIIIFIKTNWQKVNNLQTKIMTELKIPSPGESITEVVLSKWFVENGSYVENGQELGEIESDKATLPLIAPVAGKYQLL